MGGNAFFFLETVSHIHKMMGKSVIPYHFHVKNQYIHWKEQYTVKRAMHFKSKVNSSLINFLNKSVNICMP